MGDLDPVADRWPLAIQAGQPRAIEGLHDLLRTMARLDVPPIAPAQLSVLQAFADGATDRVCGRWLGLSLHTVKWQLREARRRLDARNTTHAVAIAWRLGHIR